MSHEKGGVERPIVRGSVTDKLLQFFGIGGIGATVAENAALGMADTEALTAPPGIPSPVTPGTGIMDLLTARPSAADISGFLRTPSSIPEDLVPLPPTFVPDVFDYVAGLLGKDVTPPVPGAAPPAAPAPAQNIPALLGGAGVGASPLEFRSPFISGATGPDVPLPDIPDPEGLLARLEALGPVNPAEVDPLPFILKGLTAGAGRDSLNVGELLLNAGLGALSGRADATFERGRVNREAEAANRDFQIALANAQATAEGRFFDRSVNRADRLQKRADRRGELERAEQAALTPRIESGFLLAPKREGEEVVTSVKNLRPNAAGDLTSLKIALGIAVAQKSPSVAFSALQAKEPGVIKSAADALGIAMGTGVVLSLDQKSRIVSGVLEQRPDLLVEIEGISQLLGTLSGLGGRIPTGF